MTKSLCSSLLASILLIAGCASSPKGSHSYRDAFDPVEVHQMNPAPTGGRVFERTLVLLNARRELRPATTITNITTTLVTNSVVTPVTNITVTWSTNINRAFATNQLPPPLVTAVTNVLATPEGETNQVTLITNTPPTSVLTNVSSSITGTGSSTSAPGQTGSLLSLQSLSTHQLVIATNNLAITIADTRVINAETNISIAYLTNTTVTTITTTNRSVEPASLQTRDSFLVVEFTPPPDFTLASSGDTIVLSLDGVRFGFPQAQSNTALIARRGFNTVLCKVPDSLFEQIANAKTARIRIRGNTSVIEKDLSPRTKSAFLNFLQSAPTNPTAASPAPSQSGTPAPTAVGLREPGADQARR